MICIYSQNNTNYEANGDAVLEPISCDLEITINGAWSLTLEHPYDPEGKYKYIVEGAVIRADIRCVRELTGIRQRFRIYDYKKGLHSVTAIAFPIAMESTYDAPIDNLVIQNKTGIQAMADLQTKTNKYTLATDITKIASSSFANTNVNSAIASGSDNCFIKVWGGEILYDNLTFNVKSRIGDIEAGDHQVTYGHNLTDITYTKDDSGLITRIYPISQDGIRLNGTGYVDSPKISDYPIIHSHFIQAPYTLINTDAASPSQTAQQTRTSGAAVNTSANTLALSSYSTALAAGYEPEYIKGIRQEIIQAVQTMALASVISTSLYNYLSGIISNAMSFMSELEQPAWDWMGSWEDGWKYGNENGYAVSRYVKIGKTWSYFGEDGNWQEPRDDSGTWDWYQAQADPGRRYGNFTHYYAHNENVYITMSGTLTKYYFDSDGWYDDSKTEASTWDWHGSGTAEDPYWFGESDATSEDSNKYAHDCWLFIDGSLYFFDHFGYYTPGNKFADYQWDWVETSDGFWFGNAIDQTYGAVYLKSQWAKINGDWIYFDVNGYAVQENASQSAAVEVFTTGMAGLKTVVDAQTTILYDLLYSLMTQYANSRYAAGVDVPAVTITVDMADLSKTTEYAGFENLETVKLGDAVICTDNEHNISMTSRVIGLTYDCIRDYNSTIVIGKAGASISSIVGNANSEVVTGGFDTTALEAQIAALQNKVGDIFMNDASIVSNGVGRFAIQPGENILISRAGNTLTISGKGGSNIYYGTEEPAASLGVDRDLYCKLGDLPTYIVDSVEYNNLDHNALTKIAYNEFSGNMSGVQVATSLHDLDREYIYLDGLIKGNTYTLTVKCTLTDGIIHRYSSGSYANNYFTVTDDTEDFSNPPIIILDDTFNTEQTKSSTFVAKDTNILVFAFWAMQDGHNAAITCSSIKIEGNFRKIVKIYDKVGIGWVDYVGGESYTAGSGIEINSNNEISAPVMTGATADADGASGIVPKPFIADKEKFLRGDGVWAEVKGGAMVYYGTSAPSASVGENGDKYYQLSGQGKIVNKYIKLGDTWTCEGEEIVLTTKTITQNGTYNAADDNADGYSSVTVAVANSFELIDHDYVSVNGGGWIVFDNISENENYKVEIDFEYSSVSDGMSVCGEYNSHFTWYQNNWYVGTGNGEANVSANPWSGRHTVVINNENNKCTLDENVIATYVPTNNSNVHYAIFGRAANDGFSKFKGKLYSYKITDKSTNTVILSLKPATLYIANNAFEGVLYDEVTGKLYRTPDMVAGDNT